MDNRGNNFGDGIGMKLLNPYKIRTEYIQQDCVTACAVLSKISYESRWMLSLF